EVAAGEAAEDGGAARVRPLTLEGEVDLLDGIGHGSGRTTTPLEGASTLMPLRRSSGLGILEAQMPPEITCRMLVVGDEEPEHVAQLLNGCGVEARAARDPDHALSDLLHGAPFGPQAPPNAIVVNVHHDRELLVRS